MHCRACCEHNLAGAYFVFKIEKNGKCGGGGKKMLNMLNIVAGEMYY